MANDKKYNRDKQEVMSRSIVMGIECADKNVFTRNYIQVNKAKTIK